MTQHFDIAVVGNGLIGSAASRYLSAMGLTVAAIGPEEPPNYQAHQGVFASHYDQGRITRITDPDLIWGTLAARSIAAYHKVERASGVTFHHPTGHLRVSPNGPANQERLEKAEEVGRTLGAVYTWQRHTDLARIFPTLRFADGSQAIWERGGAGYVNPRQMAQAQLIVAAKQGATVVRETVVKVQKQNGSVELMTDANQTYKAHKVLVAAGAYSGFLLDRPLDLQRKAVTVLLAELGPRDAGRLAGLPSIIYYVDDHPVISSIYSAPPTGYPDGKLYFKIGGTLHTPVYLHTPEEIRGWFHTTGNPIESAALHEVLLNMIPGLQPLSFQTRPCVVTYTAHEYPYVDQFDDGQIFLAAGGCGSSAKSANEIGHIAARLVAKGRWDYDLPAHNFKACFLS